MSKTLYTLDDLLTLMSCLRDPSDGCPWDQKQTLASIVPHTLDEVYEVIDAIEREDYDHLKDELGDLLFQVVFYAQICREEARFDCAGIIDGLTRKLLRRHPHVFPDGTLGSFGFGADLSEQQIKKNWERIKAEERQQKALAGDNKDEVTDALHSALDDISTSQPSLMRAHKLQKRAASVGFDWKSLPPVLDNLEAELLELREALAEGDQASVVDELGDVFFSCVNLARHLKQDSEQVLRQANSKFEQRFRQVELLASTGGIDMAEASDEILEQLWQQAKADLKTN